MKSAYKLLAILCLIALCMPWFISCGDDKEVEDNSKAITINVFNWGEYISDGFDGSMDVNAEFEKYYYEKYGVKVKVNYSTYATNEDMYSKLKSNAGSYDIVIPSDYMIDKMIKEDMLIPFDANKIPNYKNIYDEFKGLYYDPDEMYSVPYTYGMLGIIYNEEFIDPEDYEDESWSLLWNEKYKGKILQFNNPRDAFATAMYYTGLDVNSTDKADWDKGLEKLKEQKPLIQAYVNDEIFNKMATASAYIAPYFAGDYLTMAADNEDLKFYYPKEGVNLFVDAMCIPKSSKHPDIAMEYINFMLSPEPAIENALYIGYASPNKVVVENEDYIAGISELNENAMEILYGTSPEEINAEYNAKFGTTCYESFSPEIQDHVNMLWESLKTENATEPWVHVTAIIIVAAVITLAIYTTVIKKIRSKDYRLRDKLKKKAKANKQ
jgi:spermidine/putrescine transport system substrate-binding protein